MNEEKIISVIVPVYNAEKVIGKCIESLVEQTYKNLEILLVNDGSKDKSLKICNMYAEKYSNIIVINQDNKGVGIARNKGLELSKGEYICFVDADDYVDAQYIELLYHNMIQNNAELSICGYKEVKDNTILSSTAGSIQIMNQQDAMLELLKVDSFRGYVWNKLFRADIIRSQNIIFDVSIALWEDVLFVFQYLTSCKTVIYDASPVYNYVFMDNSASHMDNHVIGVDKSYDAILAKNRISEILPEEYSEVKALLSGRYLSSALATLRNIGYLNDDSNGYSEKCIEILKKHKKNGYKYLSFKEKVIVNLFLISPDFVFGLYRKKNR